MVGNSSSSSLIQVRSERKGAVLSIRLNQTDSLKLVEGGAWLVLPKLGIAAGTIRVTIPSGSLLDLAGNPAKAIETHFTCLADAKDERAPILIMSDPAHSAEETPHNLQKIRLWFSEDVHQADRKVTLCSLLPRVAADGRRTASEGREAAFGGRSADRQQRRKKKAFDRGGPVWPPRSNAKDDRSGGGGFWGGVFPPPQPKPGGSRGQRPPVKTFRKNSKTKKSKYFYFFLPYFFHVTFFFLSTECLCSAASNQGAKDEGLKDMELPSTITLLINWSTQN